MVRQTLLHVLLNLFYECSPIFHFPYTFPEWVESLQRWFRAICFCLPESNLIKEIKSILCRCKFRNKITKFG